MPDISALLDVLDIRSGRTTDLDPYDCLCAMFDVARALHWLDPNTVPASWEFHPGPLGGCDLGKHERNAYLYDWHCEECRVSRDLLRAAGLPSDMFAWPYGQGYDSNGAYDVGKRAEQALIELGNYLEPFAALSEV